MLGITAPSLSGAETRHCGVLRYEAGAAKGGSRRAREIAATTAYMRFQPQRRRVWFDESRKSADYTECGTTPNSRLARRSAGLGRRLVRLVIRIRRACAACMTHSSRNTTMASASAMVARCCAAAILTAGRLPAADKMCSLTRPILLKNSV